MKTDLSHQRENVATAAFRFRRNNLIIAASRGVLAIARLFVYLSSV